MPIMSTFISHKHDIWDFNWYGLTLISTWISNHSNKRVPSASHQYPPGSLRRPSAVVPGPWHYPGCEPLVPEPVEYVQRCLGQRPQARPPDLRWRWDPDDSRIGGSVCAGQHRPDIHTYKYASILTKLISYITSVNRRSTSFSRSDDI